MGNEQLLKQNTDIVIDGFPKCGNSFSEAAFRAILPEQTLLATHCHAPAQILRAVHKNIPTVLLYRQPDDAVASYMDMLQSEKAAKELYIDYRVFYESLLPVLDQLICANFQDMIKSFPNIVWKLNEKFDLELEAPNVDEEFMQKINSIRDQRSALRIGRAPIYSDSYGLEFQEARIIRRRYMESIIKTHETEDHRLRAVEVYKKIRYHDLSRHSLQNALLK